MNTYELKIENGTDITLKFNVYDILDTFSKEQKIQFISAATCQDDVFREVVHVITDRYTLLGFAPSSWVLKECRDIIISNMNDIENEVIKDLKEKVSQLERALELQRVEFLNWSRHL